MAKLNNNSLNQLVAESDTTGTLQLQVNSTTGLSINANQAIGVGSTPNYGTAGQVLASAGTGAAATWASTVANATNATNATNIVGGVAGALPYQTAPGVTNFTAAGTAGQILTSSGAGAPTWATITSTPTIVRSQRTSNTILGTADASTLIAITSGTFTQTFTAAATLGSGWFCYIQNAGTGDITLDPNGSETIDGLTSYIMYPGETRLVQCDGTGFNSIVIDGFYATFTSSGTFIKPPGYRQLAGLIWGGGGGGNRDDTNNAGFGGGGGACVPFSLQTSSISASITVTIGAGGAGRSSNADGGNGGDSSFGTLVYGYGGGGAGGSGGAGGGALSAGVTGTPGRPYTNNAIRANTGFGGGSYNYDAAYGGAGSRGESLYGGGGGGDASGSTVGGGSRFGGAGGAGSSSGTATAGTAPSGGGGGSFSGTSAAGARGELRVWGVV